MVLSAGAARLRPFFDTSGLDRNPVVYWPESPLLADIDTQTGPIIVTVTYTVLPENQSAFLEAMEQVRRSRLRTGATRWELFRESDAPDRYVEFFRLPSWDEHMRQHGGRLTGADRMFEEKAQSLAVSFPEVKHLVSAGE